VLLTAGVGMYFTFLKFYTKMLVVPAGGGALLFLSQLVLGYDSVVAPFFCIG
jgi:Calcium-activated chloride channel